MLRYCLTLLMFLAAVHAMAFQKLTDFTKPYYGMVDRVFDEQEAFNTVAFIEKCWRVVGNEGFNQSIRHVVEKLQRAGFVEESKASNTDRLTYRVEKRPLSRPTWEPVGGFLSLKNGETLLNFGSNRNMIAMNAYGTSGTQVYEVVYVGAGRELDFSQDLTGKVVFAETSVGYLFREAVQKRGAAGVIAYRMPTYTQPEKNQHSIQFSGIPRDAGKRSWGVLLSYAAKEKLKAALKEGNVTVLVNIETKIYESEELTVVAELKGSQLSEERFVYSAHVQEPGANDNASGVAVLTQVAVTSAKLLKAKEIDPVRTITYLFGDEIISTRRYVQEDKKRAENIKWGMSLDMVGEDTDKTGGSFLIEKMPDPGAIWIRGREKHTEWGGEPLSKKDMRPHYFNDLVINRFIEQGKAKNWTVNTNPFEGGSDHVPFLQGGIPGLLLWHFTDQFYHTDQDRLDKVSATTMKNVGTAALVTALVLTSNHPKLAGLILEETKQAAIDRLREEFALSQQALAGGAGLMTEKDILNTWTGWYLKALESTKDLGNRSSDFKKQLRGAKKEVKQLNKELIQLLMNNY